MKKASLFLISAGFFWGMIKLLQKTKDNHQVFAQGEQEVPNQSEIGYNNNEIASFLRSSEKSIR